MADERKELLKLSAHRSVRGKPSELEVEVLRREPLSSGEDPNTHHQVFSNRSWLNAVNLDFRHHRHIFPGAIVVENGPSGGRELLVVTQEAWRGGELVRAVANDPRPLYARKPTFASVAS